MAKRSNGEGTIRKRADGRWEGRYYDPIADKQRSIYGKTQKDVREKITNICNQMNMNGFISPSKITLNEWFEQYIRLYKEGNIKPQSISVMRNGYDSNIKQYIGEKRLQEISEFDIKNVLIAMQENQLAYNTISRVFGCLKNIFERAKKKKLIPENPTEFIQIKNISGDSQTKRELTDYEIYWFFKGLNEYKPNEVLFFELLNATGARVGEIASLKWSDILQDFTIMSICSTYIEYYDPSINSKVKTINSPKSKASKRTVPIPDYLQKKLKEYKERKRFIDNQFNRIFKEDSFIFTNSDGELRNTAYYAYVMKSVFNYLLKEYNIQLEHFTAHYFRHTFASRAIRNNVSLETLKELLGHSNYEMISNIYAHSSQEDKIKAVRTIANELQSPVLKMESLSNENYQAG